MPRHAHACQHLTNTRGRLLHVLVHLQQTSVRYHATSLFKPQRTYSIVFTLDDPSSRSAPEAPTECLFLFLLERFRRGLRQATSYPSIVSNKSVPTHLRDFDVALDDPISGRTADTPAQGRLVLLLQTITLRDNLHSRVLSAFQRLECRTCLYRSLGLSFDDPVAGSAPLTPTQGFLFLLLKRTFWVLWCGERCISQATR